MHLIIDNWFLTPSQPRQLYQDEMVTDNAEEEPRRRKNCGSSWREKKAYFKQYVRKGTKTEK